MRFVFCMQKLLRYKYEWRLQAELLTFPKNPENLPLIYSWRVVTITHFLCKKLILRNAERTDKGTAVFFIQPIPG